MSRTKCPNCGANRGIQEFPGGTWCHACHVKEGSRSLLNSGIDETRGHLGVLKIDLAPVTENPESVEYLKQYYFTDEALEDGTIFYSRHSGRIVFPLFGKDQTICAAWCRAVNMRKTLKWLFLGNPAYKHFRYLTESNKRCLCITEDIISAQRVAHYIDSIALCGTQLTSLIETACLEYEAIVIWLDGDAAGKAGANKIKKKLQLFRKVVIISTKKDPKEYTNEQIVHTIVEGLSGLSTPMET